MFFSFSTAGLAATELQDSTLEHLGVERSFSYHLPTDFISKGQMPAIIILHGAMGSGKQAAQRWGFNKLADKKGFIALYPDGLHRQWNDGRGINFGEDYSEEGDVDDVGFISALITHATKNFNADPKRIYVVGASNGGMMALRVGCELSKKVAGVGAVIANIPENMYDQCKPVRPLPFILINGTDDPVVQYDGGPVTVKGQEYGNLVSTDETIALWTENNKCGEDTDVIALPDNNSDDDSTVTLKHFVNCTKGADVELYSIEGGGHMIPGVKAPLASMFQGKANQDIKTADVVWEFFLGKKPSAPAN